MILLVYNRWRHPFLPSKAKREKTQRENSQYWRIHRVRNSNNFQRFLNHRDRRKLSYPRWVATSSQGFRGRKGERKGIGVINSWKRQFEPGGGWANGGPSRVPFISGPLSLSLPSSEWNVHISTFYLWAETIRQRPRVLMSARCAVSIAAATHIFDRLPNTATWNLYTGKNPAPYPRLSFPPVVPWNLDNPGGDKAERNPRNILIKPRVPRV